MGFVLATFNVLDLFDANDPRIESLAALLKPHAPEVVALQEVGGAEPTDALARALGGTWDTVLGDADDRGIRCAVISRRPIAARNVLRAETLSFPRFHREDPEPFASRIPLRRSIPEVVVETDIGRVRVLVVHFKSRRPKAMIDDASPPSTAELAAGEARAVVWRCAEALFVRRAIDERLSSAPDEQLCVCGDFNDVPDSLPLRIAAGTAGVEPDASRPDALVSCVESIPIAQRFSVDHDGDPAAIDHVLMSRVLASRFSRASYERAKTPPDPPSDHAPLIVHFL